jgi:radical SAM enzyme (TIGR01210 family)
VKIYNAGSFFDRAAVPSSVVAQAVPLLRGFEKVIVESHPAFVGDAIWRFRDAISPARLQIAMGLETAHPQALLALNKGFSVEKFGTAAEELRINGVELRSFLLVRPPFLDRQTGRDWVKRSIGFSFNVGASVVSLILTRPGNGALDALEKSGLFVPPKLAELEESLAFGLSLSRGVVLADLWSLERLRDVEPDFDGMLKRLAQMNSEQRPVVKALDASS